MPPASCRLLAIALSTALLLQSSARADDFTWVGGSSTQWNQPLNWANSTDPPTDSDGIPDANDLATFLTNAEVDSGTVQTLAIGPQAGLTLTTNRRIRTANFVNDGALILAPDGGRDTIDSIGFTWTTLSFAGDVILGGSGEIVMNDRGDNLLRIANQSVINDTVHTIRGAGIIEVFRSTQEQTASFTNRGHIIAEQGELLIVGQDQSSNRVTPGGVFTNAGVIEARDNSVLELDRLNITNFGETRLGTNAQILLSTNTLSNSIINPGNVLTFDVTGGGGLNTVGGVLQNNGMILIDPVGDPSINDTTPTNGIRFSGDARLEGVGEVVLRDRFDHQLNVSSQSVANGPAHTIRGSGRISLGGTDSSFINEGVIRVEQGGVDISGLQSRGVFTNTGVIEVTDGETLALSSLANVTDFGMIELGSGATVLFSGDLTNSRIRAGTAITIGRRSGSSFARVEGTLQNDGQLLFPEGDASLQFLSGAQATLGGAGEIVLDNRQSSSLSPQSSIDISSATVTNAPSHTIRGSGRISLGGTDSSFINKGVIRVEQGGADISGLQSRGVFTNTGVIEVADGETLALSSLANVTDFGTIELGSGSAVLFSGTLTNSRIRTGTAVTIGRRSGSSFARVEGTLQNDGQLLFPEGDASLQFLSGAQATLGGSGEIVLDNLQPSSLAAQSSIDISSATVNNGASHTIRGSGRISLNGTDPSFTNEGLLRVDFGGIEIDGNSRGIFANTGVIEVMSNSTLEFRSVPSLSLATGEVRLAISGGDNGTIETRSSLMLDGTIALLLEIERFQDFGFQATGGEFFDLVVAEGGLDITAADFVVLTTAAGSSLLNDVPLTPYNSGVAADTDALFQAPETFFNFELVNDGTTLRATLLETLNIPLFPDGDYNRDGIVGVEDYQVWLESVGESGPGNPADGNGDGFVNTADYAVWRDQFAAATASNSTIPIPEPSALLLVISLLPSFALRRSKRLTEG